METSTLASTTATDVPSLLLGGGGGRELERVLQRSGVTDQVTSETTGLSSTARRAVLKRLGDAVAPLLDVDLASIVVKGWSASGKLRSAGELTRTDATRTEFVELAKHTISTTRKPRAELVIADKVVAHLELELTICLDIQCATATVAHGRMLALTAGRCKATVTLSAGGQEQVKREAPVDMEFTRALGDGLPIPRPRGPRIVRLPEQEKAPADTAG